MRSLRSLRCAVVPLGCAALAALAAAAPAAGVGAPAADVGTPAGSLRLALAPSIAVTRPLPGIVRIGDRVTVTGRVRGAPVRATVVLQARGSHVWTVLAGAKLRAHSHFTVIWRVAKLTPFATFSWRVAAVEGGRVLAVTAPAQSFVGPAAVYCAPAVPPAVDIPVGYGWIVGGLYTRGGAYPGVFACSSRPYTVTATSTSPPFQASQNVAALHSYTLVVPAGRYALKSDFCLGSAVVSAGRQTQANTFCDVP